MNLSQSIQKKSMIFFASLLMAIYSYAIPPPPSGGGNVPSYVPSNGLVGWWPFNGNANDESGNGNNGTVNGATLVSDRNGVNSSAFSFNGTNNKIVISNSLLSNSFSSYTTSVWIRTSSQTTQMIYSDRGPGSFWYKNASSVQAPFSGGWNHVSHNNGCVNQANTITHPVWDGSWHHLVGVFDAQALNIKLYQDGVLMVTQPSITPTCYGNVSQPTTIGCFSGGGYPDQFFFNGQIDDIGIWNRALTQQEIGSLFLAGQPCPGIAPITGSGILNVGGNTSLSNASQGGTWSSSNTNVATVNSNGVVFGISAGAATITYQLNTVCGIEQTSKNLVVIAPSAPGCLPGYLPLNDLVGFWPFCGNTNDESGNGQHGIPLNFSLTENRFGDSQQACFFGPDNSRSVEILLNDSVKNNFTFSCWVLPEVQFGGDLSNYLENVSCGPVSCGLCPPPPALYNRLFEVDGVNNNYQTYFSTCQDGLVVSEAISGLVNLPRLVSSAVITSWSQFTVVYRTDSLIAYLNGVPLSRRALPCLGTDRYLPRNIRLLGGPNFFLGSIDDIAIWNRALTPQEISALYTAQSPCTSPLASITPPSTTILCNSGGSINLNANTGSGLTYQWQLNGNDIQGATAATYAVVSPGSYTVTVSSGTNCQTTSSAIVITQGNTPLAPVSIGGPAGVCRGQNSVVFTTPAVSGATQYNWTLPSDATGSSTSNSISVSFGSVFNTGNISVSAANSCGTSSAFSRSIALYTVKPATPGLISGPAVDVCSGTIHSYSVASVANTTTYNWTVPTGCTIISGQGSNAIQLTVPSGFISGNVAVNASNCIGASTNRTLTIRGVPGTPGTISGPINTVCPGTTPTYSIAAVLGASSYTWVMPVGVSLVSGQGTRTIVVSIQSGFVSGNIGVRAVSACGTGAVRNLAIRSVPPQPPTIIGQQDNLCGGNPYTYSTAGSASATSYTWTVPSGATFTNPTPTTCAVTFPASLLSGNVTVIANNACGASLPRSITVGTAPKTPTTISGPASVCAGQQGVSYSVTPINGATNLQWQVPTGSTIVSGQGSPSITMNFGSTAGNVRVQAINACASGTTVQKAVNFNCRTEGELEQTQEAGIENTAANYLTAYPNPATDRLILSADELSLSERPFIIISDVSGRAVWSGQLLRNNMEIDLSALSSGMYFIRANTSVALPVLRLVKH